MPPRMTVLAFIHTSNFIANGNRHIHFEEINDKVSRQINGCSRLNRHLAFRIFDSARERGCVKEQIDYTRINHQQMKSRMER